MELALVWQNSILSQHFDMAELPEENLELELRRSLEGEESKPVPAHKLRPVGYLLGWVRHFAGIVVRSHPSKAVDLWAYLAIILSGGEQGDWWRAYDAQFRQQMPSLDKAEFGRLDQALYTRCLQSSGSSGTQRTARGPSSDSGLVPKVKRRRTPCVSPGTTDEHVPQHSAFSSTSALAMDHRKAMCSPSGEGKSSAS